MKNQSVLVKCPECKCSVRSDRLEKHLRKAHGFSAKEAIAERDYVQFGIPSDSRRFKEVCLLIEEFLARRNIFLESLEYVEDFSLIAFEMILGYTIDEVITIGGIQNRATYKSNSNKIKHLFFPLVEPLKTLLEPYKTGRSSSFSTSRSSGKPQKSKNLKLYDDCYTEGNRSVALNWYDCNSVDSNDASKYIGFYQREYGGSRFGSYPIHDDYSEESWADSNPWE